MSGSDDKELHIVPLQQEHFHEAAMLYQHVWHDENAYAEVFEYDQARKAIEGLRQPWVIRDKGKVTGLVGGMPLTEYIAHIEFTDEDHQNGHVRKALDELVTCYDKCYYIDTVAIAPVHQEKGLGTRLLKFIN
jgi:hypothetical protein